MENCHEKSLLVFYSFGFAIYGSRDTPPYFFFSSDLHYRTFPLWRCRKKPSFRYFAYKKFKRKNKSLTCVFYFGKRKEKKKKCLCKNLETEAWLKKKKINNRFPVLKTIPGRGKKVPEFFFFFFCRGYGLLDFVYWVTRVSYDMLQFVCVNVNDFIVEWIQIANVTVLGY